MNNQINRLHSSEPVAISVLAASAMVTLIMLGWLFFRCRYGFDFTDDSYYLIWMANPWLYDLSASQFGFMYHPLHRLFGGNIVLLRQVNLLITFGLGWLLCAVFFQRTIALPGPASSTRDLPIWTVSAVMASSTLVLFSAVYGWLPTPNYNGLGLQAMLLAGAGILLSEKSASRSSIIGWVLIGVSGWLAFMAKPTTGAALGVTIGAYLFLSGKFSIRLAALAVFTAAALIIASAWMIDGSVLTFAERLAGGKEIYRRVDAGHTLSQSFRIDRFTLGREDILILVVTALATWICIHLSFSDKRGLAIAGISLFVTMEWIILDLFTTGILPQMTLKDDLERGLLIWAPLLGVLAAAATSGRMAAGLSGITRPQWILALCFLVFPHVYAFGSGTNYWHLGSGAGIFWVLAGLVVLLPVIANRGDWRMLLPIAVNVQAIAVFLLYLGMDNPYRQPQPLRLNTQAVTVGNSGVRLVLSDPFAGYLRRVSDLARSAGFQPGTPMIDLTGRFPGVLYAFGAKSIGQPWTVGGYKGSEALAVFMLDRVPCEDIAQAWLLVEPLGKRSLNPEILKEYGLSFPSDYIRAGDLIEGHQSVFKPARPLSEAAEACRRQRKESPK